MYLLFFFLVSFPIPFFGIPTNNLFFFSTLVVFIIVSTLRDFYISKYLLAFLLIIILFLIYVLSSDLPFYTNTFLSFLRYIVALCPLLTFNLVLNIFQKSRRISTLYSFYIFTLFVLGIISFLPYCSTAYGGLCVFFQRSSSFGSVVCPLVIFQLASILLSSIRLTKLLRLFSILTIVIYLYLGLSLGARLYYILLFVGFTAIVIHFIARSLPSLYNLRVSSSLRTAIILFSFISLITTSIILYYSDLFISLMRLISFLRSPLDDYRFSTGLFFSTRSDQSLVQFLFGNQIFSELPTWNSISAYDSTINLFLSDFGLIGSLFLLLIISISLYFPFIRLKKYNYSHFIFSTSILLYVLASLTNEFLLLKALNPFFVMTTSLVSIFVITDSISTDS